MNAPRIIAHRGASGEAPENTLPAFREAWRQDADAVEGDFRLTADGVVVCCHDATTERTAGESLTVAETAFERLRELDVGSWKGERWEGARIPRIDEVFGQVPPEKGVVLEIKCGSEIIPALDEALVHARLSSSQLTVISLDEAFLHAFKQCHPMVTTRWITDLSRSTRGQLIPNRTEILRALARSKADGLSAFAHPGLTAEWIEAIRQEGYAFHVWTVDDPAWARQLMGMGVQSITTNVPAALRAGLAE